MAESATIARPYAEALFRVAKQGNMTAWVRLISEMAYVAAHPDVVQLMRNPSLSDQQIEDVFLSALKTPIDLEAKNFIATLIANNRLELLPEMATQFQALCHASEGCADAEIVSAFDLSQAQLQALVVLLEKRFGRKLNPMVTVDSTLIGGVRVVVGDAVLDTSVRAKLGQMSVALTN